MRRCEEAVGAENVGEMLSDWTEEMMQMQNNASAKASALRKPLCIPNLPHIPLIRALRTPPNTLRIPFAHRMVASGSLRLPPGSRPPYANSRWAGAMHQS